MVVAATVVDVKTPLIVVSSSIDGVSGEVTCSSVLADGVGVISSFVEVGILSISVGLSQAKNVMLEARHIRREPADQVFSLNL